MERVAVADFSTADMIVQFGVAPGRIDIITSVEAVDFGEAWPDRLTVVMDGVTANVIGREHLLRNKLSEADAKSARDHQRPVGVTTLNSLDAEDLR